MKDSAYSNYPFDLSEIPHEYGENVHLISDPLLTTWLAKLSSPETIQPAITNLVRELYTSLLKTVIARETPRIEVEEPTRMHAVSPKGIWQGPILDPNTRYVTVDIARAGTLPSQIAFELLNTVVNPQGVRQDHLYMNRATNEAGEVCGINHSGSKIGGDIENAIVLFPDPMGATGASMSDALKIYKKLEGGAPKQLITVHLIVTPEYIRTIQSEHPDTVIYALRLDRAMSSAQALSSAPGKYPEEESGLNEVQYIVPGAGGVGEILNNSFV